LRPYRDSWYAVPTTIAAFVVLAFVLVPILGMSVVTGVVFGPWLGSVWALLGCMASAATSFLVGRWLGQEVVQRLGGRMRRFDRYLGRNGIAAVYLIRKIPAPFVLINLMVGASRIRFVDFMVGTLLGLGPFVIVLATLGSQLDSALRDPSATSWSLVLLLVSLGVALAVNQVVKHRRHEAA